MAGADQIDVMTSLTLQVEHQGSNLLGGHFIASPFLADRPILAMNAA
jgi:hypothetical protein